MGHKHWQGWQGFPDLSGIQSKGSGITDRLEPGRLNTSDIILLQQLQIVGIKPCPLGYLLKR